MPRSETRRDDDRGLPAVRSVSPDWNTGQLLFAEDPTREVDTSEDDGALLAVVLGSDADEKATRREDVGASRSGWEWIPSCRFPELGLA